MEHFERSKNKMNNYNYFPNFDELENRPEQETKKSPNARRIGSTFADAVRTAQIEIKEKDENNNETVTKVNMPQDVKRFLLILASRIPPTEYNTGQPPFDAWKPITLKRTDLRAMQRDMYGESGPKQNKKLIGAIFQAATTSVVNIRFVEAPSKGNKPKRGEATCVSCTFLKDIKIPSHIENGQEVIDGDPEYISITLNNIFGYWLNRFYGTADVQSMVKRSRGKGGMEYLALRLWAIGITPQVAAATKGKNFEATFAIANLTGEALTTNPDGSPIERTKASKSARKEIRKRLEGVVNEAAKDMGATYLGLAYERKQGGQKIIGLRFRWIQKSKENVGKK